MCIFSSGRKPASAAPAAEPKAAVVARINPQPSAAPNDVSTTLIGNEEWRRG